MYLNQELLQLCEEFFDQISNPENSEELSDEILSLRSFLENDVDGYTQLSDERLGRAVQSRLYRIWKLISKKERAENQDLEIQYKEIIALTEDASGYESDDFKDDENFLEDEE